MSCSRGLHELKIGLSLDGGWLVCDGRLGY